MSRACIGLRISIILVFIYSVGLSQTTVSDTAFYRHLVIEGLVPEQLAFNRQILAQHNNDKVVADSTYINIALAYTKLNNYDSALANLKRISVKPNLTLYSANNYLALLVLNNQYNMVDSYTAGFNNLRPQSSTEAELATTMLERKPTIQDTDIAGLSPAMQGIKMRYEKNPVHSAFLAAAYSAIIPGLGKLYLGYKAEALSDFVANAALGAQTAESYFRAGPKSARFIVSGTLFTLFYGGNIWGSALLAKKQKRDHYRQTEYEIHNYYNTGIGITAK